MKPMLVPTAADVVRCIKETMDTVITPAFPEGSSEISFATTIGHLLSYVEHRIEDEGQQLFDEVRYLRGVFPEALGWLAGRPGTEALAAAIRASLDARRDPDVYPSLSLMAVEVGELRQHICDLLELVHADGEPAGGTAALHATLREYMRWQIQLEGKLVEPAFVGRGPRR